MPKDAESPGADRLDELQTRFEVALQRRVGTSGTLGALLSSGVDSNLIVAGVRELLGLPLATFTFRYMEYDGPFNEDSISAERARRMGTDHETIEFRPADLAARFSDVVTAFGEPFVQGVHTFILDRVRHADVTALLSGVGPDAWYFDERVAARLQLLRHLPAALGRAGMAATEMLCKPMPAVSEVYRTLFAAYEGLQYDQVLATPRARIQLHADPSTTDRGRAEQRSILAEARKALAGEAPADREIFAAHLCLNADQGILWNHRWGQANGIEIRHPYYDLPLYESFMHLSRGGRQKDDVRRLAERVMPTADAWTPKIYQSVPIVPWLQGPLADLVRDVLAPARLRRSGLLQVAAVQQLVDEHTSGAPSTVTGTAGRWVGGYPMSPRRRAFTIWALMTLTEWHLSVLAAPVTTASDQLPTNDGL